MKKIIILVLLVVCIGVIWLFFVSSDSVLGQDIKLYSYVVDGEAIGGGTVSLPFLKDMQEKETRYLHVAVDADKNGIYEDSEWITRNAPAIIYKDYNNNFVLDFSKRNIDASSPQKILAVLTEDVSSGDPMVGALESVEKEVSAEPYELGEIMGFNVPGASEDLKRGPAPVFSLNVPVVYAQSNTGAVSASRDARVPDLPQGSMECSAVSAANNLISLAGEHGELDNLPQNTRELINELKTDMQFNNGILNSNFKAGKDAFVARHNLPIVTRRISNPTFADLTTALNSGGAVELSTRMVQSASGRASTGHTMTLVGASQTAAGGQSVQVHDSASPQGADTLSLNRAQTPSGQEFLVVVYPLWDGVVLVDDIFVQNWTEPERAETGTQTDAGEETSLVEVLVIGGSYYPKSQFRVAGKDACNSDHYHGGTVYGFRTKTSSEIVNMTDPAPSNCGFGRVAEVPVERIDITFEQSQALIRFLPN